MQCYSFQFLFSFLLKLNVEVILSIFISDFIDLVKVLTMSRNEE